jgi:probable HAF family extracellular repeat protein
MSQRKLCLIMPAIALALVGEAVAQPQSRFISFDLPQAQGSSAWGINDDGAVAGTYTDAAGKYHGFLLKDGFFTTIDYPDSLKTWVRGINSQGDIVGYHTDAAGQPGGGYRGFLWHQGQFTDINSPNHLNTMPTRISDEGVIVGCAHDNDMMRSIHGFTYTNGTFTELSTQASMNNAVSSDGSMVAGFVFPDLMNSDFDRGYIAISGKITPFDFPFSTFTDVWDMNPAGEIVGDYGDSAGNEHGFVLKPSMLDSTFGVQLPASVSPSFNFVGIDYPGANLTQVNGINRHGDVVGLYVDSAKKQHAFLLPRPRPHHQ